MLFWVLVQEEMLFNENSIFSSAWQLLFLPNRTVCAILVEGIMGNILFWFVVLHLSQQLYGHVEIVINPTTLFKERVYSQSPLDWWFDILASLATAV